MINSFSCGFDRSRNLILIWCCTYTKKTKTKRERGAVSGVWNLLALQHRVTTCQLAVTAEEGRGRSEANGRLFNLVTGTSRHESQGCVCEPQHDYFSLKLSLDNTKYCAKLSG